MSKISARWIIGLPAAGLLLGIAAFVAYQEGVGTTWSRVPDPPQRPFHLTASREGTLYITMPTDQTYACETWRDDCWQESKIPNDIQDGWTLRNPCTRWPEFLFISRPPSPILECIDDEGVYAEFYNRHVYALDTHGKIWEWAHMTHAFEDLFSLVCFPIFGLILGAVIAAIIAFVSRTTARKSKPIGDDNGQTIRRSWPGVEWKAIDAV